MMKLSCNSWIKLLRVYSLLLLLSGCAALGAAYDLSSCSERGGKIVYQCTSLDPYDPYNCKRSESVCMGSMTHAQFEKLNAPEVYVPPPDLSEDEKARKKAREDEQAREDILRWQKRLNEMATRKLLTRNADKYPKLSWLSSKWCLKGSDSKIPVNYYKVRKTGIGSLSIDYHDIDVEFKSFTHVEIIGKYYDLWDGGGYSEDLQDEQGRRLEKHSDREFSLVYRFKDRSFGYAGDYLGGGAIPGSWSNEKVRKYAKGKALELSPEQYIKNPEVYVKCK